jgi:hypothetical protein
MASDDATSSVRDGIQTKLVDPSSYGRCSRSMSRKSVGSPFPDFGLRRKLYGLFARGSASRPRHRRGR